MSVCSSAGILGTGHYAPERLLTNFDLEKLVDTTDEWKPATWQPPLKIHRICV